MTTTTPTRSQSLRLIQGIAVACLLRDNAAAKQGLRLIAEVLEPKEAEQSLRQLVTCLEPEQRYWLGTIDGHRVSQQA